MGGAASPDGRFVARHRSTQRRSTLLRTSPGHAAPLQEGGGRTDRRRPPPARAMRDLACVPADQCCRILPRNASARDSAVAEELCRRPVLGDGSAIDEEHAVGDPAGEAHLVGHADHGHAVPGKCRHHVENFRDHLGVEGRGRLVEQDRDRIHGERARNGHALLLPARELAGYSWRESARPTRSSRPWLCGRGIRAAPEDLHPARASGCP